MAIVAYYHVTPAGAGLKDGSTWAKAMGVGEYQTFKNSTLLAGHVVFIADGAYTMTASIDSSARDGTAASPICEIGVKAGTTNEGAAVVYSDWSRTAADQPVITAAAYTFTHGDYERFHNIELSITSANGWLAGTNNILENCKVTNSSGTAGRYGFRSASTGMFIVNCEAISTNGIAIVPNTNAIMLFNYAHDSVTGANFGASSISVGNVFDTCSTQGTAQSSASSGCIHLNNTFYAGGKGLVLATTCFGNIIINNIFEGQTTSGISQGTQTDFNLFMENHGNDARCTDYLVNVDATTVFQDYWVTTGDPLFSNPVSGLFNLGAGSPCLDSGVANSLISAASTINKGTWQNPVGAGGGLLNPLGFNGGING